jgi:hypothetical protein
VEESVKSHERVRKIWESRIKEWRASGLSQGEYCRRNGLRIKSFAYWKKKETGQAKGVKFVPIPIPLMESEKTESCIKVILGARYVIEIRDGFTPSTLRDVVRTLEVA